MQSNEELRAIFEADQADRHGAMPQDVIERDRARRARVEQLLADGAVRSAEDHLHAAFVFQHGDELAHYWQAHELALRADELGDQGHARWLAAAAYDRWLMFQGRPQRYGTQYRGVGGQYELYPVDPATTDEERARWNVPPLAEAEARAAEFTREAVEDSRRASVGRVLDTARVPNLRVVVVAVSPDEPTFGDEALPTPSPLAADQPHPLPAYLPAGLIPHSFGEGYCGVDAAGQFQVTWIELLLPPEEELLVPWDSAEGPSPAIQGFELRGRPMIAVAGSWSPLSRERPPLLLTRAGPDSCWLVSGRLAIDELARVAVSLPGG